MNTLADEIPRLIGKRFGADITSGLSTRAELHKPAAEFLGVLALHCNSAQVGIGNSPSDFADRLRCIIRCIAGRGRKVMNANPNLYVLPLPNNFTQPVLDVTHISCLSCLKCPDILPVQRSKLAILNLAVSSRLAAVVMSKTSWRNTRKLCLAPEGVTWHDTGRTVASKVLMGMVHLRVRCSDKSQSFFQ